MANPNRGSFAFKFIAPVFGDDVTIGNEIGNAQTREQAMELYRAHYEKTGREVVAAAKLKREPGTVGPEYGWVPVFPTR